MRRLQGPHFLSKGRVLYCCCAGLCSAERHLLSQAGVRRVAPSVKEGSPIGADLFCGETAHCRRWFSCAVVGRLRFRRDRLRQTTDVCVVTAQLPSAHIGPIFEDVGIELIPRTASKQIPAHVFPVHLDARRARTLDEEQTLVWILARLPIDQQLATSALSGFWCACKGKRAHMAVRECDFCRACCANTGVRGRRRCAVSIVLVLRT